VNRTALLINTLFRVVGSNLNPRRQVYSLHMPSHRARATLSISAATMIALLLIAAGLNISGTSASTQVGQVPPALPPGYPGDAQISSLGSSLIPMIENTSQFQSLANGLQYHIQPYSSFGYDWGPNIAPIETVIFYSPNMSGQIEVDVFAGNGAIQHMYFDNSTLLGYRAGSAMA